jgi:hypothetical protein
VSKRLASLGALTKGDRRAAVGSDMSSFDLDSKYGKRALKRLYVKLQNIEVVGMEEPTSSHFLPALNAGKVIDDFVTELKATNDPLLKSLPLENTRSMQVLVLCVCLEEFDKIGLDRDARAKVDVRMFLNRLAGIKVSRQALIFSLFMATLDDIIKEASATGEFEGTAEDITATHVNVGKETVLAIDPSSGAPTKMTTLLLDRGVSFELACDMALEEAAKLENDQDEPMSETKSVLFGGGLETDHDDLNGFIVNDSQSEDNEWMSLAKPTKLGTRAEPGFYISKNKIAGRHLILLAKGKFDYASFGSKEVTNNFDPMRWMQVTRPNTGATIVDMSTADLQKKYNLACSCKVLKGIAKDCSKSLVDIVKSSNKLVGQLWEAAFNESYHFQSKNGLAPRRVKVTLVNGPVLHILSALEKVVMFRSNKDKSLKIMRAQVGSRRIVGVRFPHDDETTQQLEEELEKIRKARSNTGRLYTDEDLEPLCVKSQQWATAERKTITSFFKVQTVAEKIINNDSNDIKTNRSASLPAKRSRSAPLASTSKKSKTMQSFFSKSRGETELEMKTEPIDLTMDS